MIDRKGKQFGALWTEQPCTVETCDRQAVARGWCKSHYERWKRHGDPLVGGAFRGHTSPTPAIMPTVTFKRFLRDRGQTIATVFPGDPRMRRLAERPYVSIYAADRLACAIDVHPYCIWPEWFDLPVEEAS